MDDEDMDMLFDRMSVDEVTTCHENNLDTNERSPCLTTFTSQLVPPNAHQSLASDRLEPCRWLKCTCLPERPQQNAIAVNPTSPLKQIEVILERVISALVADDGSHVVIRLKRRKTHGAMATSDLSSSTVADSMISFPGKTKQEAWQFS